MGQVVGAFGSATRILEIAEVSPKIGKKHNADNVKLPSVKGVIELRNVNFCYPTRENHPVLNLSIKYIQMSDLYIFVGITRL